MRHLVLILALICACDSTSSQSADGDACKDSSDCKSGYCAGGFCGGQSCDCDPLTERDCGDPHPGDGCQSGWMCAGTSATLKITGFCKLPCAPGCPSTWTCHGDGLCAYDAPSPTVTIQSAVAEVETGATAAFEASATSPNGAITAIVWDFGDSQGAEGAEVSHTYSDAGDFTYSATATDVSGSAAHQSAVIRVCLPDGSACYPFDSRGACCTGKRCVDTDGNGAHCQD